MPLDKDKHGTTVDFNEVVMAPICAHDCFHCHWRWSDSASSKGSLGWNATDPYMVPGSKMIPHHHEVHLWLDSETVMVVHEFAEHLDDRWIDADNWEIFHYQGLVYAVGASTVTISAMRMSVQTLCPVFTKADYTDVRADASWAVFYWHLRYRMDQNGNVTERVKRWEGR